MLQIATEDPLIHLQEIRHLFTSNDRAHIAAFVDRAYPSAAASGAASCVARDALGQLVGHVALFRFAVRRGSDELRAGLLVNLLLAPEHRTFFPALSLLRRLISDVRLAGDLDFIYSDPNSMAAPLLQACHFAPVGRLTRFVALVSHPRAAVDAAIALRAQWHRPLRSGGLRVEPFAHAADALYQRPATDAPGLGFVHDETLYHARLTGYPELYIGLGVTSPQGELWATALVRQPGNDGTAKISALYGGAAVPTRAVLAALLRHFRRTCNFRKLAIWTLDSSNRASVFQDAGFFNRGDGTPVYALPFTTAGRGAVRDAHSWEITDLDCDR